MSIYLPIGAEALPAYAQKTAADLPEYIREQYVALHTRYLLEQRFLREHRDEFDAWVKDQDR